MIRLSSALRAAALAAVAGAAAAQPAVLPGLPPAPQAAHAARQAAAGSDAASFLVFLGANPIGREEVTVVELADGWAVRGSGRLGFPLDIVTDQAEVRYDEANRPRQLTVIGTVRGVRAELHTSFAGGRASSRLTQGEETRDEVDEVSADAVVLPNTFLGSYVALARRLAGAQAGGELRAYVPPQAELTVRVAGLAPERIETPQRAIAATRYALAFATPGGDLAATLWADERGRLLRLSVPAQRLELAREDVASAATRTAAFSIEGDESVRIPASGFSLAAAITRPAGPVRPRPAVVLVPGSGPIDRDGFVAGIPIIGLLARDLVQAGFVVVRYDKRGVGQSGGRTEAATLADYAEDVRAIVEWLDRQRRRDVDRRRIAVVGHSEGAWVAMIAAARDRRIAALGLIAAPASTGADLVLEQQAHALARLGVSEAEAAQRVTLQRQIHAAVLGDGSWDGVPVELRAQADTPWFRSFLAFDPARVLRDTRQPILVLQGALDTQVKPHHAERLVELARGRRRAGGAELVIVPGVNHLLVSAGTGEVDEYGTLAGREVAVPVTAALALWLTKTLAR